ncbi:MAG: anti-sigma factor family protein, partial [Candidatus Polarisedimenticolia bacterium]
MKHGSDSHPTDPLSAYMDGEMSREERVGIETHIAGCPTCRGAMEDYRVLAAAAADETPPPVPADLHARIRHRIDAARPAGLAGWRRLLPSYRLALAAAASALLVIGLWATRVERPVAPSSEHQNSETPAPASPSRADRDAADRLWSLGYVGSGADRPEPPMPPTGPAPLPAAPGRPPGSPAPPISAVPPEPGGPSGARVERSLRKRAREEADMGLLKIEPPADDPPILVEGESIGGAYGDAAGVDAAGAAGPAEGAGAAGGTA